MAENFEVMLTGGHPNSLGRTIEVVDLVLADKARLRDLYDCYFSEDEIVRLRVSNGVRRVCVEHPEWLDPYVDGLLSEIAAIDQASTQWTLAKLFQMLKPRMSAGQIDKATALMKENVAHHHDWIVLNNTMETLSEWAVDDDGLKAWLKPQLERHAKDTRKSVSARARKFIKALFETA